MSTVIKSGDSGYVAKVDANNRLFTSSNSHPAEEIGAENGESFILHAECKLAVAGSGGLMYFKSTDPDRYVHITRMYFDAHTLSKNIIIYQVKDPTSIDTAGTDISTTGMINKNYSSGKVTVGTLVASDASNAITYTGGSSYHAFVLQSLGSTQRDMKGTNVLGNNDMLLFGWATLDGTDAAVTDNISLSINYYRRPVE